jgi:hypothetical protein
MHNSDGKNRKSKIELTSYLGLQLTLIDLHTHTSPLDVVHKFGSLTNPLSNS